ncbi:EF-P 5-aminopentanol modification-associated protein YfmH [Bhargavaea massiliensis]|uniref:EF-P 5-aminopentanol modification-associated protein YfmH n=1 Tax=Bhargavaea massiliensis TaxID=2697500 RepID=UPI001BCF489C|nr:pitrilysin family protein [Bhargavaea massiliensis]
MKKLEYNRVNETLYHETLPNGLQVFILPKAGFSKTYVSFTTRYGSIDNTFIPLGKDEIVRVPDGIAHFLEHKMFEKEDGDVFQKFGMNGASANAFTSFTRTAYLFSATENLYPNTELLLDFVQAPYFTEETVEKEKGIIGQEITMYDDLPDWRSYFGTIENLYKEHPVKIDIAGTIESISKITADHLYECYHTFYHPSNMLVFAVGAVDPEEMMAFIRDNQAAKSFEKPERIVRQFPQEKMEAAVKEGSLEMDVTKPKVHVGIKLPALAEEGLEGLKQELAYQIMIDLLYGKTSKFYTEAYEEGLIDESFSTDFTAEEGFAFSVIGSDSAKPEELTRKIQDTLQWASEKFPFGQEDLDRQRRRRIGFFMRALNSVEYIANQFTRYAFNGMNLFDTVSALEALEVKDLQDVLVPLTDEQARTIFTVKPPANEK